MKWSKNELLRAPNGLVSFNEELTFGKEAFERSNSLRGLQDVTVSGQLRYEPYNEEVNVNLHIEGVMNVACSITLEDVEIPFTSDSDEIFTFLKNKKDEDIHECKGDVVELLPVIFQLILMEVPLKVVKEGFTDYPKGNGWEVVKEEVHRENKRDVIDPRLAKLKEFKIEE